MFVGFRVAAVATFLILTCRVSAKLTKEYTDCFNEFDACGCWPNAPMTQFGIVLGKHNNNETIAKEDRYLGTQNSCAFMNCLKSSLKSNNCLLTTKCAANRASLESQLDKALTTFYDLPGLKEICAGTTFENAEKQAQKVLEIDKTCHDQLDNCGCGWGEFWKLVAFGNEGNIDHDYFTRYCGHQHCIDNCKCDCRQTDKNMTLHQETVQLLAKNPKFKQYQQTCIDAAKPFIRTK